MRFNWIEAVVLPPAAAVLTTSWVALAVRWSVRAVPPEYSAPPVAPAALGLLLLGGLFVTRWAQRAKQPPAAGRLAVAAGGVAAVFGTAWLTYGFQSPVEFVRRLVDWGAFISPVFLGLMACAFMWWQGIMLGRSTMPQEHLERLFYSGIAAFALLFGVNQLQPLIGSGEAVLAAMGFFATGLGSLALVSVENARRWQSKVSGAWPSLNRYWLSTVAGVIGSILVGGLLAAALLSPETFARLNALLAWLANAVTIALVALLGTVVFLAAWLVTPVLERIATSLGVNPFRFPRLPPLEAIGPRTLDWVERYPVLNVARQALSLLLLAAVVGIVFWWAVRRFGRLAQRDVDEVRDNIASAQLLLEQLRGMFRRRRRVAAAGSPYLPLGGPRDDPRLMVRRAYQSMLAWTQSFSLPARRAGETPNTYAAILAEALPAGREAFETLTATYLQARYAAQAPTLADAQRVQVALGRLQVLGADWVKSGQPPSS